MAAVGVSSGHTSPGMTGARLNMQEQKDMERFVKFLTQKMVQVIIQSRLGERIYTPCKSHPSTSDWFNLGIEDIPEVLIETKKAMNGKILFPGTPPLCVEISLRTVEGDSLVLENWSLSAAETAEPTSRVTYTVYSRMSLLLKSIISVSRITPAHKLSGRQGADSFVLCYRVFLGEAHSLGTSVRSCIIGQVDTPIGLYCIQLSYRTQLTLSPKDGAMLVKSDHFTPEFSPRLCRADRKQVDSSSGSEQVTTSDESQDACRLFVNSPPNNKIGTVGSADYQQQQHRFSFEDAPKYGAFVDRHRRHTFSAEFALPELPIPTFMKMHIKEEPPPKKDMTQRPQFPVKESVKEGSSEGDLTIDPTHSTSSIGPMSNEDFVMVESLKTPFADGDGSHDVGAFFRDCQSAPLSLQSFRGLAVSDIGNQLEQFEKDLKGYDDLVKSLCRDPDDKS